LNQAERAMNATKRSPGHRVPVYEVRLVQTRKALRLAEDCLLEPSRSARALHALIGRTDREHLACLFVNGMHRVTGAHIAAIGGQNLIGTVDVRVILRAALAACSSGIVLGHNHPSGNPSPSAEDFATTANIMRAANVIGIPVLDHVIVTRDELRYYSMFSRGTLPNVST
jgi:DNA repair protein RadC